MQDFTGFYKDTPRVLVKLPEDMVFPVKYAIIRRRSMNNTFGMVRRNRDGSARPHQGWDFYAPPNYRCYAIADGTVAAVRNHGAAGYGRHVLLEFSCDFDGDGKRDRLFAAYCHLNRVDVTVGQRVHKGDVIGLCGDTGNARGMVGTDAHLHFEIRTTLNTGRGLSGRISPLAVFRAIPLNDIMVTDRSLLPDPRK